MKGKVFRKSAGKGSKFEHEGVFIKNKQREYQLQEIGGPFFNNEKLAGLVGKTVELEGKVYEKRLMIKTEELIAALQRKDPE